MNTSTLLDHARQALATAAGAAALAGLVAGIRSRPVVSTDHGVGPESRDASEPPSMLVPAKSHRFGPATRATMRRLGLIVGATQAAGVALAVLPRSPRLNAFGTGLIVPGAGHLYRGHVPGAALAAASLPASLTLFFATGNNLAPPLAWLGSAAHAGLRTKGERSSPVVPVAACAAVAGVYAIEYRRRRALLAEQQAKGVAVNGYLSQVTPPLRGSDRSGVVAAEELSTTELAMARRLVDVALQDGNDWTNYELIDQFRESAARYAMTGYMRGLQAMQYSRMPAFRGYVSEGQRRLILKHQQPLVWRYWFWENLWGNLRVNPDPVVRQNIMLTGWLATTIGAYERITGDLRFSEPGALNFIVTSQLSYAYSHTEMLEELARQFEEAPVGLVACEPNWVYTVCNTYGVSGAYLHSKVHGSDLFDRIGPRYLQGFRDEMVGPDGRTRLYLSTRTGFAGPSAAGIGDSVYHRAYAPELADRAWALTRLAFGQGQDGELHLNLPQKGMFDVGNYSATSTGAYASIAFAMREAGDEELAQAALRDLQSQTEVFIDDRGWLTVAGASNLVHADVALAMLGRKGTWLNMMDKGMPDHWANGPLLEEVPYPSVMVGRAVSNDGNDLEFVLHPGAGGGRHTVELSHLVPGGTYQARGAVTEDFVADDTGTASVVVDVHGRTPVHIVPKL